VKRRDSFPALPAPTATRSPAATRSAWLAASRKSGSSLTTWSSRWPLAAPPLC